MYPADVWWNSAETTPPAGTDATTSETGWMKPVLQMMSSESISMIGCGSQPHEHMTIHSSLKETLTYSVGRRYTDGDSMTLFNAIDSNSLR